MKHDFLLMALLIGLLPAASAQAQATDTSSVQQPALRDELLAMEKADQEVRTALIANLGADGKPDSLDLARMGAIDAKNTARLKEIIEQYRWPSAERVGRDGTEAAFLLVQHSPDWSFQEEMLPVIERAYRGGELEGQHYALLLDRVRVHQGRPQVYGTQMKPFEEWEDGEPVPDPIEDEANVDERRAEVGLFPMEVYFEILKKMYLKQGQN